MAQPPRTPDDKSSDATPDEPEKDAPDSAAMAASLAPDTGEPAEPEIPEQASEEKPADEPAEAADESKPAPARTGGGQGLAIAALVVALIAVVAGTWPLWNAYLPAGMRPAPRPDATMALSARIATLESRLKALDDRVKTQAGEGEHAQSALAGRFEDAAKSVADVTARLDALDQRFGQLAGRLDALDQRLAGMASAPAGVDPAAQAAAEAAAKEAADRAAALKTETEALRSQIETLTARQKVLEETAAAGRQAAANVRGNQALVLAVGQLRDALRGSGPYREALNGVKALADDDKTITEALDPLAARAAAGVPTTDMLAARFNEVARQIALASAAPEGSDWIDRSIARIMGLVTVRRVGEDVAGETPTAKAARAEARLAAGDLAGAVKALEGLEGAPARAAAGWLADAKARLDVNRALDALTVRAVKALGGASGG